MDSYSRLVAWLKVLLPLSALALLSTLFLLSRNIDPVATIPFAENEIRERIRDQQVTEPFFSGTTDGGDGFSVTSDSMLMGSGLDHEAEDLSAQIDLASGTRVLLSADFGQFDTAAARSELSGNVVITTSQGYRMSSDALSADFDGLRVASPGPVTGQAPFGDLNAGAMILERDDTSGATHLVFTNGVNLIYQPQTREE